MQIAELIAPFSADQTRDFGKAPMSFRHRLAETGLFEDEALAELLDRYPAELYDINLFDFDADGQARMRTGVRGRLPGREVLAGIKEGRVWVQLRGVETHYPALGAAMRQAFAQISALTRGFRPVKLNGQLILSAPSAKVPYHADAPGVVLFHIRGRKRVWIYPVDEAHMPHQLMEDIVLKQQTEDLPYRREMDQAARIVDLEPGMAATWPLHAPHRVENQEGFNVSLAVDYETWGSRILNGVYYTNGLLRRAGVRVAAPDLAPAPAKVLLWAASVPLKRLPLVKDQIRDLERTFELKGAAG